MAIAKNSLVAAIRDFNQHRNPAMVQLKYAQMAKDAFRFYRGSCHLFYQDWPGSPEFVLNQSPVVYSCGDLHLGNFGAYRSDQRLVYFDINDFDEAALTPCTWDPARFLGSLWLASSVLELPERQGHRLAGYFVEAYTRTLAEGKARWLEPDLAGGMIGDIVEAVQRRNRRAFVDAQTILNNDRRPRRSLRTDNKNLRFIPESDRQGVEAIYAQWQSRQPNPAFYKILDLRYRSVGIGSLGIERYLLLVEGKGSPDRNYLLDLKLARPSSLSPYLSVPQPVWTNQAERIVTIQQRFQGTPPALLTALSLGADSQDQARPFVLKELQPENAKIDLSAWDGRFSRLKRLVISLGEILAWNQLRSSGRSGVATAQELIDFVRNAPRWQPALLEYSLTYSRKVEQDHQLFREAFDSGQLK